MNETGAGLRVAVLRMPGNDLPLPGRATPGSAGLDLSACIEQPIVLAPGQRALIPTGFAVALPAGYEAQIRPRSGLALKSGVTMLNAPGTIDADYRGEIGVVAVNLGSEPVTIRRGERIAQMVIQRIAACELVEAEGLDATRRGAGGFGSTGDA